MDSDFFHASDTAPRVMGRSHTARDHPLWTLHAPRPPPPPSPPRDAHAQRTLRGHEETRSHYQSLVCAITTGVWRYREIPRIRMTGSIWSCIWFAVRICTVGRARGTISHALAHARADNGYNRTVVPPTRRSRRRYCTTFSYNNQYRAAISCRRPRQPQRTQQENSVGYSLSYSVLSEDVLHARVKPSASLCDK